MLVYYYFLILTLVVSVPFEKYTNFVNRKITPVKPDHCVWLREHCGLTLSSGPVHKVIGGMPVIEGSMKWVVYLKVLIEETTHEFFAENDEIAYKSPTKTVPVITHCTGTLISRKHVLTAAHCFMNNEITYEPTSTSCLLKTRQTTETIFKAKIYTGAVERYKGKEHTEIGRILADDFFRSKENNDYVIVEIQEALDEKYMLSSESMTIPACLPPSYDFTLKQNLLIAGFGLYTDDLNSAGILRYTHVNVEPCDSAILAQIRNLFDPICTSHASVMGDSGSGYMQTIGNRNQFTVVGVSSKHIAITDKRTSARKIQDIGIKLWRKRNSNYEIPLRWIKRNTGIGGIDPK